MTCWREPHKRRVLRCPRMRHLTQAAVCLPASETQDLSSDLLCVVTEARRDWRVRTQLTQARIWTPHRRHDISHRPAGLCVAHPKRDDTEGVRTWNGTVAASSAISASPSAWLALRPNVSTTHLKRTPGPSHGAIRGPACAAAPALSSSSVLPTAQSSYKPCTAGQCVPCARWSARAGCRCKPGGCAGATAAQGPVVWRVHRAGNMLRCWKPDALPPARLGEWRLDAAHLHQDCPPRHLPGDAVRQSVHEPHGREGRVVCYMPDVQQRRGSAGQLAGGHKLGLSEVEQPVDEVHKRGARLTARSATVLTRCRRCKGCLQGGSVCARRCERHGDLRQPPPRRHHLRRVSTRA
jgi:hypothetical protein